MKVHLFANGSHAERAFQPLKRSRRYELAVSEPVEPTRAIRRCEEGEFVYFEVTHLDEPKLVALARKLRKVAPCPFGFIHADDGTADPSRLFFAGAADFVGSALLEQGITTKRMDEVVRFARRVQLPEGRGTPGEDGQVQSEETIDTSRYIVSGGDWGSVESSHEYTFWLLFAELDHVAEYAKHTSEAYTDELIAAFRSHLTTAVAPYGGRVWIWKKAGGILLFPFDGRSCTPIVPIMRLVLNRAIANVEEFTLKSELSCRLALHLGNTVFEAEGRTGGIVSETVNFVFHLGQRFLSPGHTVVTGEAFDFVPRSLRPYFTAADSFEGHAVHGLRRRIAGAEAQ